MMTRRVVVLVFSSVCVHVHGGVGLPSTRVVVGGVLSISAASCATLSAVVVQELLATHTALPILSQVS